MLFELISFENMTLQQSKWEQMPLEQMSLEQKWRRQRAKQNDDYLSMNKFVQKFWPPHQHRYD